jgi:hypothetical protein
MVNHPNRRTQTTARYPGLRAIARKRVGYNQVWWIGGITRHQGHPFIVECVHRHETRADAVDCAECAFHCDDGSQTDELLRRAML